MVLVVDAAHFQHFIQAVQEGLVVMTQAARIVVDDVLKEGQAILDLEHLVHLLLVFHAGEADLRILHHVGHFLRHGVLVHHHRNAAKALAGRHRPVQARPVVTHHRQPVPAPETQLRQATGNRAHALGHFSPGVGLPDPVFLLAHRRPVGPLPGMVHQQARKGIQAPCLGRCRSGIGHTPSSSGFVSVSSPQLLPAAP